MDAGSDGEDSVKSGERACICAVFPDRLDCHYHGVWESCDKETCRREHQCARRTQRVSLVQRSDAASHGLLPDCMMPDGAEPCAAYQHLERELARAKSATETNEAARREAYHRDVGAFVPGKK